MVTIAPPVLLPFYGVQVGEVGLETLGQLKARGWGLMRTTPKGVANVLAAGLTPLVVCRPVDIPTLPDGLHVEIYNEPDIGCAPDWPKLSPTEYCARIHAVLDQAYAKNLKLWLPTVSNTSPDNLKWLRETLACLPPEIAISYHRYPQHNWDVASVPRKPYRTRQDEFNALKTLIGPRKWGCTEFGWHQDPMKQPVFLWFTRTRVLTDQEIEDRMRMEFLYLKQQGASFGVWYQVVDGPGAQFGLCHEGWTDWKPQSTLPRRMV